MRTLVALLITFTVTAGSAIAQPENGRRIGVLALAPGAVEAIRMWSFPVLAQQGFVEGRNLTFEARVGPATQMPDLARDLVASKPDVIIAVSAAPLVAARDATETVPILTFGANPVAIGLATDFARPSRNVTGIIIVSSELDAKRLQILADALPGVRRLSAMILRSQPTGPQSRRLLQEAASALGITLSTLVVEETDEYPPAFAAMEQDSSQGAVVTANPIFYRHSERIAELAVAARQPTICEWREMAERGCLLSYGPNRTELYRRLGDFLGRILAGINPEHLPIEQPTKFELIVNLKVARKLGIEIPPAFLAGADYVIE